MNPASNRGEGIVLQKPNRRILQLSSQPSQSENHDQLVGFEYRTVLKAY